MGGKNQFKLTPSVQLSANLAMRFSNVLEMSEEDVTRLSSILESDPLFKKLFYAQDPSWKIFSRARFPGSRLSTSFYDAPEKAAAQPQASPEVESVLAKHADLIECIRQIGLEKFENSFLYDDGEKSSATLAEELGVPLETVNSIRTLTDEVVMSPEFFEAKLARASAPELGGRVTLLAEFVPVGGGKFDLSFLSPAMARGTYKIHYDKLQNLKQSGSLTDKEKKTAQDTIRMLEMINSRRTLIYRILTRLPSWQEDFFAKQDWDGLNPMTQKKAAEELKVTPAAVCRAIQSRSVLVGPGREVSLNDFFPSKKDLQKRKISRFIKENRGKTDEEIRQALERDFEIKLSRRSVNVYRNEILGKKKRR